MKKTLIAALLAAAPFTTMAASAKSVGYLDVYYTDAELDVGGGSDDGDGFGIRGAGKFSDQAFIFGEYQSNNYDDSDADIDQIRAGVGYIFSQDHNLKLYGKLGFINIKVDGGGSDESENGWTAHAGAAFALTPAFKLFGELGYADVADFGDGLEYLIGAGYSFTEQFGGMLNYRVSELDGDFGDFELSDLQVGVRFNF